MASTEELSKIGKGITLLITKVTERNHALVRFADIHYEDDGDPSEEARSAISFANACLPFDPEKAEIRYRKSGRFLIVPLSAASHYAELGFKIKNVPLPRHKL